MCCIGQGLFTAVSTGHVLHRRGKDRPRYSVSNHVVPHTASTDPTGPIFYPASERQICGDFRALPKLMDQDRHQFAQGQNHVRLVRDQSNPYWDHCV